MTAKKILAIKLRELGDVVLWTPALKSLRHQMPDARIDLLVLKSSEPVLRRLPGIDRIWTVPSNRSLPVLRQVLKLRAERYDLALGFHINTSFARMARFLGARQLVLHHHSWKYNPRSATLKVPRPGNLEDVLKRDFQLLEAIGQKGLVPDSPKLYLTPEEIKFGEEQLSQHQARRWVALLPGARAQTRRYPIDLWLRAVDKFSNQPDLSPVVLVDSVLSQEWNLKEVCAARKIPLFDNLNLREFMAVLSQCEIAVGNDSGPIHMAAALGLKTVTLFGAGCYGDFHPYDHRTHIPLWKAVPCRNGGPRELPEFQFCNLLQCGHLTCMRRLPPESIWDSVSELASR
jgi:ADP-heptose:LPS heptosyltransferase